MPAPAAKRCADENGVVLTLHQNFEPADTEADDERFGRPAVEHLNELGILGPMTTLAHMNVLRDAAILDPQHRHFLECAWEALEDAGHTPASFPGPIGVFRPPPRS